MQKSALLILAMLVVGSYAACTKPQAIYHVAGSSLFFKINDIQESILEVFGDTKLKDVKYDVSKTLPPHKEVYTLKDIVPHVVYNGNNEKETLGPNTIVKTGGVMDIEVEFKYDYVNGVKTGSGTGIGKFSKTFPVTLTKNANYDPSKGLQWTCEFTDLSLENMLFLKQTGGELDLKTTTTFGELLNQSLGANYECVKSQLEVMLKTVQPKINDVNNNEVYALFNTTVEYGWDGKRMTLDETLLGYSLSGTGETMQVLGVPKSATACYDISLFQKNQGTYFAVSNSLVENSYNFLVSNNYLFSSMDPITWHIPNFYFTVRDLAFAIPKITQKHDLSENIGGSCNWASGNPPAYNSNSNGFDLSMKYTCSLNTLRDNNLVLTFFVTANLTLIPEYDDVKSVQVVIKKASFSGSEFNPSPQYTPVSNTDLLNYFVSQAAKSLENTAVFGSGLIYLPPTVENPTWEMSSDQQTIFFYDASNTVTTTETPIQ